VFIFLLVLLILDAILLIPVVLLQAGKGDGLAAVGGGAAASNLLGSRQAATLLTRATWWTGGIFVALSFALSMLSSRPQRADSILRSEFQGKRPAPTAPATVPGLTKSAAPATQQAPAGNAPATPAKKP
jgi:preprotein translocase subunit SecG